ncbi:MAG TPA: FAD-dependent oxidoreductase [Dehalococcoidia bacterium]|nr:FAD-dependent oxidoreductase [Dehalococcoidia bacterium]
MLETTLLIIGAGPYGLAAAAYAAERGIDALLVGEPMSFWREHMPAGMLLRSPLDWQIDPFGRRTLLAFLLERGIPVAQADPLPVEIFRDYALWFQESYGLQPRPLWITGIEKSDGGLAANCEGDELILACSVLLAPGFAPFACIPPELARLLPEGRYSHTCDTIDLEHFRGQRCLIIGGRQSAYEWAALMAEAGAAAVHVSHRHEQPRFQASDWSWVGAMIDATAAQRGWWRNLPSAERESIRRHFWAEGRLKLEPWLAPRLNRAAIRSWPRTALVACEEAAGGALSMRFDSGDAVTVDHILFATGYKVDVAAQPILSHRSIASELVAVDGFPELDEDFQSSVDGLFLAGLPASRDFGPFFGFVSGAPLAARLIIERVAERSI